MIGKAKLAHQAAFPTISGKAIAGRETEKGEIIVSKEEENETKKEPPNCSFQRTRIPPFRVPPATSAPLNSSLGVKILVEATRLAKRCYEIEIR